MESEYTLSANTGLEMATNDYYRKIAEGYRGSEQYNSMINLYPILGTLINECEDEELIN